MENPSMAKLIGWVSDEREAYLKDMNEGAIRNKVRNLLEDRTRTVFLKFLGFDYRWGKWDVDHCNGRQGNSYIGGALDAAIRLEAQQWVEDHIEDIRKVLDGVAKTAIRNEVKNLAQYHIRSIVKGRIDDLLQEKMDEILQDNGMEIAMQLVKANTRKRGDV